MTITRMFTSILLAACLTGYAGTLRADDCQGISCKCMDCGDGESSSGSSGGGNNSGGPMGRPAPGFTGIAQSLFLWPFVLVVDAAVAPIAFVKAPFDDGAMLGRVWDAAYDYCPVVVVARAVSAPKDQN